MSPLNPIAKFFEEKTISASAFAQEPDMEFEFRATGIMIAVDTDGAVEYSFDGQNVHGKLYADDKFGSFDDIDESKIWFRKASEEAPSIRLWAWEKKK